MYVCACWVASVMFDSLWPYGLLPSRLLCPWDSPGKNTGVDCHSHFQGIFPIQGSNPCLIPPALADEFFTTSAIWEAHYIHIPTHTYIYLHLNHIIFKYIVFVKSWKQYSFSLLFVFVVRCPLAWLITMWAVELNNDENTGLKLKLVCTLL